MAADDRRVPAGRATEAGRRRSSTPPRGRATSTACRSSSRAMCASAPRAVGDCRVRAALPLPLPRVHRHARDDEHWGPSRYTCRSATPGTCVLGEIPGAVMTGDGTLLNRETCNWAPWEPKVGNNDDALEMIRDGHGPAPRAGRDFLVYGRMQRPAEVEGSRRSSSGSTRGRHARARRRPRGVAGAGRPPRRGAGQLDDRSAGSVRA